MRAPLYMRAKSSDNYAVYTANESEGKTYSFDTEWGADTFIRIVNRYDESLIWQKYGQLLSFRPTGELSKLIMEDMTWFGAVVVVMCGINSRITNGKIQCVEVVLEKVKNFLTILWKGTGNEHDNQ